MVWDPFGDLGSRGILRNRFGLHDPDELANLEYTFIRANMPEALALLGRERKIDLTSWRRTHRALFKDIYPWAGRIRHIDVERGQVRFNTVARIVAETNAVFERCDTSGFLQANLGYVYGELAFNHPFLDGNGRSLNAIFSEMCRRDGFDIAWNRVRKDQYLLHLTRAVALREYDGLHSLLGDLTNVPEQDARRTGRLVFHARR